MGTMSQFEPILEFRKETMKGSLGSDDEAFLKL